VGTHRASGDDPTTIDRLRSTALAFISEANELVAERTVFVARPVSLPSQLPPFSHRDTISMPWRRARTHSACLQSVGNPTRKRSARYGWRDCPRTVPLPGRHVRTYVKFHEKLISLSSRMGELARELLVSTKSTSGLRILLRLMPLPTDFGSRSSITFAHAEKSPISWPALSEAEMKRQPSCSSLFDRLKFGTACVFCVGKASQRGERKKSGWRLINSGLAIALCGRLRFRFCRTSSESAIPS